MVFVRRVGQGGGDLHRRARGYGGSIPARASVLVGVVCLAMGIGMYGDPTAESDHRLAPQDSPSPYVPVAADSGVDGRAALEGRLGTKWAPRGSEGRAVRPPLSALVVTGARNLSDPNVAVMLGVGALLVLMALVMTWGELGKTDRSN